MKKIDPLFKALYQKTFYAGSFYEDLKVGRPEEYDLDLLLKLPRFVRPEVVVTHKHGYVQIKTKENLNGHTKSEQYS